MMRRIALFVVISIFVVEMQQGHGAPSKPKPKSDNPLKSNSATKRKQSKDIIVTNDVSCIKVNTSQHMDPYNNSCPDSTSHSVDAGLSKRSSCPWYTVHTHDNNRYPTDIVEIVCHLCKSCNHKLSKKESSCEPIFFEVPVLVRCNFPNKKSKKFYAPTTQRIVVGCTCASTPAS